MNNDIGGALLSKASLVPSESAHGAAEDVPAVVSDEPRTEEPLAGVDDVGDRRGGVYLQWLSYWYNDSCDEANIAPMESLIIHFSSPPGQKKR